MLLFIVFIFLALNVDLSSSINTTILKLKLMDLKRHLENMRLQTIYCNGCVLLGVDLKERIREVEQMYDSIILEENNKYYGIL